jgi:hypothetical protein
MIIVKALSSASPRNDFMEVGFRKMPAFTTQADRNEDARALWRLPTRTAK